MFALGIRHIGETTARALAKAFGTFKNLRAAIAAASKAAPGPDYLRLTRLKGLGPKSAEALIQYASAHTKHGGICSPTNRTTLQLWPMSLREFVWRVRRL